MKSLHPKAHSDARKCVFFFFFCCHPSLSRASDRVQKKKIGNNVALLSLRDFILANLTLFY